MLGVLDELLPDEPESDDDFVLESDEPELDEPDEPESLEPEPDFSDPFEAARLSVR